MMVRFYTKLCEVLKVWFSPVDEAEIAKWPDKGYW